MEYRIVDEVHTSTRTRYLTFSAKEVGKIAMMVIKGVEREEAIRSMPRYSKTQHEVYAAFYDNLCKVITVSAQGE